MLELQADTLVGIHEKVCYYCPILIKTGMCYNFSIIPQYQIS
jgi:hypothetical protein